MPPAKKKKAVKTQYYTIQFERYMEVVEETNKVYYILADKISEIIEKTNIREWSEVPAITDFFESFVLVDSFRVFLDEKINNPTDEETEFIIKHNIKDVLFNKEEIGAMQQFFLAIEAKKEFLLYSYGFSSSIN